MSRAGTHSRPSCLREALERKFLLFYGILPKRGVSADPKVLSHFFFVLKQSKANKSQCAKRLKNSEKVIFEIFC